MTSIDWRSDRPYMSDLYPNPPFLSRHSELYRDGINNNHRQIGDVGPLDRQVLSKILTITYTRQLEVTFYLLLLTFLKFTGLKDPYVCLCVLWVPRGDGTGDSRERYLVPQVFPFSDLQSETYWDSEQGKGCFLTCSGNYCDLPRRPRHVLWWGMFSPLSSSIVTTLTAVSGIQGPFER